MESSGKNRYELLFMDDEAINVPESFQNNVTTGKKKVEVAPRNITKSEKENKLNILNKTDINVKNLNKLSEKKGFVSTNILKGVKELSTGSNVRMSTSENIHSNITEYNNELPQRQIRDRDIKGTSRSRVNDKFGKREFDRQSGSAKTGVKSIDKRDGAGAHNWGSAKQDIKELKASSTSPVIDKEDPSNEQPSDLINNLEEEEIKQMTLDEWKALKEQRIKPNYNLRKAGEGVDNSEWKKMTVLSKKKQIDTDEELEYDPSMYPQRVGRLQRIIDIQFNFNDGRKPSFRKGPRQFIRPRLELPSNSFEKGLYNVGGIKRSGPKTLKMDDEIQFPTLS